MKVRMGFVSNSSSQSFCLYGVQDPKVVATTEELKYGPDEYIGAKIRGINKERPITDQCLIEVYTTPGDSLYVGRSWATIGDDETGRQFKAQVEKELKELLGTDDLKFETHEKGWYDG